MTRPAWHWNQKGFSSRFGITNHQEIPTGRFGHWAGRNVGLLRKSGVLAKKGLLVAGGAIDLAEIASEDTAEEMEDKAIEKLGAWTGAYAVGKAGAVGGGSLGALTGPFSPVAVPILAGAGGLIGGIGGYFGGEWLVETTQSELKRERPGGSLRSRAKRALAERNLRAIEADLKSRYQMHYEFPIQHTGEQRR